MEPTNVIGLILVVDDEKYISELLKYNLESERYSVTVSEDAHHVLDMNLAPFRLALVDAMGQTYNGMDLLHDLKDNPQTAHLPVIILSHSDSQDDIVAAFDNGADDYVLKPFSLRELMARIRSVLRRHTAPTADSQRATRLHFGTLEVDMINRQVRDDGMLVPLTRTEYAILVLLLKNKNTFFTRARIFDEIWRDPERPANDRIVDTNISRLRKKLGASGAGLVNRTGQGYAFIDDQTPGVPQQ